LGTNRIAASAIAGQTDIAENFARAGHTTRQLEERTCGSDSARDRLAGERAEVRAVLKPPKAGGVFGWLRGLGLLALIALAGLPTIGGCTLLGQGAQAVGTSVRPHVGQSAVPSSEPAPVASPSVCRAIKTLADVRKLIGKKKAELDSYVALNGLVLSQASSQGYDITFSAVELNSCGRKRGFGGESGSIHILVDNLTPGTPIKSVDDGFSFLSGQ
jgi:hypothetical protein